MKYIFLLLSASIWLSCHAAKTAQQTPEIAPKAAEVAPKFVTWDKTMVDLGTIKKGEKKQMEYNFTNTSGEKIQIDIVDACDCTKVEFPRGVLEPGASGKLQVTFDSSEKDESETIEVRVIFKNTDERGYPRIELIQYQYVLQK